jgi:plasmid replication initiation protein
MEEEFVIHKPKPLIYISNDLTQRERLIFNFLIKLVNTQNKEENPKYVFRLGNIKNICNIRDFEAIRAILYNLFEIILEIDLLKNKRKLKIMKNISMKKSEVSITFSNEFIKLFNKINSYANIDIKEQTKLKSKYSIIIYEMIKDYYRTNNSFVQIPHIEIDTFKNLMGFKNISNYDLKKIVLEKIIVDINKNTNFNFTYKFLNKIGSKKPTHIELKFSKEKSIIPKIENKKSNAEILKEIEKQRELLRLENIQIAKRRDALTKQEIYCEETTKRYESAIMELDKKIDKLSFISEILEKNN